MNKYLEDKMMAGWEKHCVEDNFDYDVPDAYKAGYRQSYEDMRNQQIPTNDAYREMLESKLAIAVEALKYYAGKEAWAYKYLDRGGWGNKVSIDDCDLYNPGKDIYLGGKLARSALAKIEGLK